jgi:hypothetical protein
MAKALCETGASRPSTGHAGRRVRPRGGSVRRAGEARERPCHPRRMGPRRVISLEPAGRSLHSQPLRVPFPPVASDEVPQPPRDRRKGRVTGTSGRRQDSDGPVRGISTIGPGACPADRAAARHRLLEVLVVSEPGEPAPGPLVHVVGQPHDVSPGVTHAVPGTFAALSPVRARFRSTFDQRRASPGVRGSGTKPSRR